MRTHFQNIYGLAVARRILSPARLERLAFVFCFACALAGPFVILPYGVRECRDELNGAIGRLQPFLVTPDCRGLILVRDGFAAQPGQPFRLHLCFPKVSGQSGQLRLDSRPLPGLATRLILRDADRPAAASLDRQAFFSSFGRPISLEPLRRARRVEMIYEANYTGPGLALVLNRIQFTLDWFPWIGPCLAVSLALGLLLTLLAKGLRPRAGALGLAGAVVFALQIAWWHSGWPALPFLYGGAAALVATALIFRAKRTPEVKSR